MTTRGDLAPFLEKRNREGPLKSVEHIIKPYTIAKRLAQAALRPTSPPKPTPVVDGQLALPHFSRFKDRTLPYHRLVGASLLSECDSLREKKHGTCQSTFFISINKRVGSVFSIDRSSDAGEQYDFTSELQQMTLS